MTDKPIQKTTRAIIFHNNKILLGQRNANDRAFPSKWCLPGGKVDEGENEEISIIREVLEETGIKVRSLKHYFKDIEVGKDFLWENFYFIAELESEIEMRIIEEDGESFQELRWVDNNQIVGMELAFDHKEIIIRFFEEHKIVEN